KKCQVLNHIGAVGSPIGKLIIAVHRYSVLTSTKYAENAWTRRCIRRLVFFQFLLPLISSIPIAFYDYIYTMRDGVSVVYAFTDPGILTQKAITTSSYLIYIVCSGVFTMMTSRALVRMSIVVADGTTRQQILRQQKSMFIIVSLCAVSHFIKALHQ
ncbi:hypothetical protein PFISCL1PPCAC_12887, partial [Pristionchus fissidentatus]